MAADDDRQPASTGLIGRLVAAVRAPVSELIGRYVLGNAQTTLYKSRSYVRTTDETRPDYEFWDKLRRCKAKGYTLAGLFCKRIENIFATWVLGQGVEITLAEGGEEGNEDDPRNVTDQEIAGFLKENAGTLLDVFRDKLGLGDQWIIVNADGSLSIPSPEASIRIAFPYAAPGLRVSGIPWLAATRDPEARMRSRSKVFVPYRCPDPCPHE